MRQLQQAMAERMLEANQRQRGARLFSSGATGRFPEGHLNSNDEGEIRLAVGHQDGKVIIDFGKPVAWLGCNSEQARLLAQSLIEHADWVDTHKNGD
jgi:hypothetical protein